MLLRRVRRSWPDHPGPIEVYDISNNQINVIAATWPADIRQIMVLPGTCRSANGSERFAVPAAPRLL